MVPIIIHNIIYNRIELDDNLFVSRNIADWDYKAFRPRSKHNLTSNVFYWCRTIASAIAKKYVRGIHLLFISTDNNKLVEHYNFTIKSCKKREVTVDSADLLAKTKKFFTFVSSLSEFRKLISDEIYVLMEMDYNMNINRAYLELPNFELTTRSEYVNRNAISNYISLGKIDTGFHALNCRADADIFHHLDQTNTSIIEIIDEEVDKVETEEFVEEPTAVVAGNDDMIISQLGSETYDNNEQQTNNDHHPKDSQLLETPYLSTTLGKRKRSTETNEKSDDNCLSISEMMDIIGKPYCAVTINDEEDSFLDQSSHSFVTADTGDSFPMKKLRRTRKGTPTPSPTVFDIDDLLLETDGKPLNADEYRPNPHIECSCTLKLSLGITRITTCAICLRTVHAVCVGYERSDSIPKPFICVLCGTRNRPATDITSRGKNSAEVKTKSIARLLLRYCTVNKKYPNELVKDFGLSFQKTIKNFLSQVSGLHINEDDSVSIDMTDNFGIFMSSLFHDYSDVPLVMTDSLIL